MTEHKKLNRIIAGIVFLASLTILVITTQTSVPFWDCSEISSAAALLQVPHPPGAPTHSLIGRVFMMFPFFELAFRMNLLSALSGALTVLMTYLSSVILISLWRGVPKSTIDKLIVYGSSIIGAMALSFSDTFWFNAVESEVFATSLFLLSFVIWLALQWYISTDENSTKYLILIGFLFGFAVGIHQLSLLAFFPIALIYYFKNYELHYKSFLIFSAAAVIVFVFFYRGILTGLPQMLGSSEKRIIIVVLFFGLLYGIYYSHKNKKGLLNFALLSILFILIGYSTYTMIVIRANKGIALNQNNPNTIEKLSGYLGREQYGDWPVVNFDKTKYGGNLFPRRWTEEGYRVEKFKLYKSDLDYFVSYQFYHMWLRYLLWNFSGRSGDVQDAPPVLFGKADSKWMVNNNGTFPNRYFGIPFLIGLIGAFYHYYKDKKFGFNLWVLFLITGIGFAFYSNMQNPQPRERDYFFIGSFFVFSLWISLGIAGILESIEKTGNPSKNKNAIITGFLSVAFIAVPANMLYQNFDDHNRHGNYLAWDLAYNILQSCPQDGILFTAGDNDTFPIWYIQDVEGVRRDVRLVNLSLINTEWYPLQMKNETPYGAKKVPISYSDEEVVTLSRQFHEWGASKQIDIPIPKKVYREFLSEELSLPDDFKSFLKISNPTMTLDSSQFPEKFSINVKSTTTAYDQRGQPHYGLRTQDLYVLDIIKTNNWQRPICFSITVSPNYKIGFDNYMRMEGMTYRLTPFNVSGRSDYIQPKILYDQISKEPENFSQLPQTGMKFRNLGNPNLYLDENAMRLAQDYRYLFMNLGAYYIYTNKNKEKALEVLSLMEKKLPSSSIKLEYRMRYNLLLFYKELESKENIEKAYSELEKDCLNEIANNPEDYNSSVNPYRILLDVYNMFQDYDKEISIYTKLQSYFPDDVGIKNRIEQLKTLKNQNKNLPKLDTLNK